MVDLYAGLGGWAEGGLAEGYDVIGFDIERHVYGEHHYPAQLVLQDVLTLHGRQFKDVALIVASPPCQAYSYMAMPWSKAKAIEAKYKSGALDVKKLTALFDACFRIQREAIEAAGHHIPMVVENVRGAQKWVGRSRWNFGSFHLWGDVPALMPTAVGRQVMKRGVAHRANGETNFHGSSARADESVKVSSEEGRRTDVGKGARFTSRDCGDEAEGLKNPGFRFDGSGRSLQSESVRRHTVHDGVKQGGDWFNARKAASAMIARIPLPLSRHIARAWHP
jgi:hypothetical protein